MLRWLKLLPLLALWCALSAWIFLLTWAKEKLEARIKDEPKPAPEEPEA